jgi:hypothetical protein
MGVDSRTVPGRSSLSIWVLRLTKFVVFASAAIATALPAGATAVTQLSVTFAPSQTFNHQPLTWTVTPANGVFSAVGIWINNGGVQFSFNETAAPSPILFADLEFIVRNGAPLVPGVYPDASNFEFAPPGATPILEIGLSGEEQDGANEEFTILQLAYTPAGAVQSFGATFEVFDGITGAVDISGVADYNFDTSLAVPEPASIGLLLACVAAILCFAALDLLQKTLRRRF